MASAAAGSAFAGWGGACAGTGACTVTMSGDTAVTATFSPAYTLTVSKSGTGTVTSAPAGISCGSSCTAIYASGAAVALTASAPMTAIQWVVLADVLADLCRRYGIPVTAKTVLSHAEVQTNLGLKQRGKWDVARLAFDPSLVGAKACGDAMRAAIAAKL